MSPWNTCEGLEALSGFTGKDDVSDSVIFSWAQKKGVGLYVPHLLFLL